MPEFKKQVAGASQKGVRLAGPEQVVPTFAERIAPQAGQLIGMSFASFIEILPLKLIGYKRR